LKEQIIFIGAIRKHMKLSLRKVFMETESILEKN